MNEERKRCDVCDNMLAITWRDAHGVGACCICGATYTIFHYEDGKRVDKPPQICIKPPFIPLLRQFWQETHRNVDSTSFNLEHSKQAVEDHQALEAWLNNHAEEYEAAKTEANKAVA